MPEMADLYGYTYDLLLQVPDGRVTTYKALANALGYTWASRGVTQMMKENGEPDKYPCYKVVRDDGTLGGYNLGIAEKEKRLRRDGIAVKEDKIADFKKRVFSEFETDFPLRGLRREQAALAGKVRLKDDFCGADLIAGIDVAYSGRNAFCALSLFSWEGEYVDTIFSKDRISFPYIPTFLSYREMPVMIGAVKKAGKDAVYVIDGNGILHPAGLGEASHMGVVLDAATIGVAKSLLCGRIDKAENRIYYDGKVAGVHHKGIFISPGHRISVDTSYGIIKKFCRYRVPEMIRTAHSKATEFKKEHEKETG